MTWRVLGLVGLLLPGMTMAQSALDPLAQADSKKVHGDFKGAVSDYSEAILQNPRDVRAYLGRATVRFFQGDYAGAIADDTRAIALDPKNAVAFGNRGNAKTARGDLPGALADYTQAITLDPQHVRAFLNRGNIKNLEKQYAAAIADYTAALALDPKNAAAYYDRAGAERALGNYDKATADYSKALDLNPVDVQAYLNRAVLEMARKNEDRATTDLKTCLGLIPEERQAYPRIYLWVIGIKQGQAGKAGDELTRYLDQSPKTFAQTWAWQIELYLAGRLDESRFLASADSFQAQKNRGQTAQARYYAGLKRAIAGDSSGATKFFRECLKKGDPSLHEFILAREELSGGSHP